MGKCLTLRVVTVAAHAAFDFGACENNRFCVVIPTSSAVAPMVAPQLGNQDRRVEQSLYRPNSRVRSSALHPRTDRSHSTVSGCEVVQHENADTVFRTCQPPVVGQQCVGEPLRGGNMKRIG